MSSWTCGALRRGNREFDLLSPAAPMQPSPTPPPPTSSHLLNRQRGMCKVRQLAEPRGSDCECARLYFLESDHFLSVPLLPSRIFCFYLPHPLKAEPTFGSTGQLTVYSGEPAVLFIIQNPAIKHSVTLATAFNYSIEIRLARALCPASISHARGTMLASLPRRRGLLSLCF